MLSSSDTPISDAIRFFADRGIEAAFLVPTATGMKKSIMDAHESLRAWLRDRELHDYSTQQQGPEHKVCVKADIVHPSGLFEVDVSLYRPKAKQGDPRIWPAGLGSQGVEPGNLLAVIKQAEDRLAIINMSNRALLATADTPGSPLDEVLREAIGERDQAAAELLGKLRVLADLGWINSLRAGDTGVGYTLETHLGIAANSSKAPDYRGIEIKAHRVQGAAPPRTRVNLFSKTPDWLNSPVKSGKQLLDACGYESLETGRKELYCTVGPRPNPQGLAFRVTETDAECWQGGSSAPRLLVRWGLDALQAQLLAKHASTFWVSADTRRADGQEQFRFTKVIHSQRPLAANLGPLIQDGTVTMDFTLSEKATGLARDHGYLFKIWPRDLHLLIPQAREYTLAT